MRLTDEQTLTLIGLLDATGAERLRGAYTFMGCEDGPDGEKRENDAVVEWCDDGHSGPGVYVSCEEYPEEGADYIEVPRDIFDRVAQPAPTKGTGP